MDIEKLIERLYKHHTDWGEGRTQDFFEVCLDCKESSTALSTLQAENEKLKDQLYDGEGVNLVNYWMQQAKIEENGHRNCQAENEKLRAELEQVIAERGALIEDFVDYVTDGVPNPAIFCKNRCNKCVDMRGWCTGKNCKGFYPSVASGQKED